MDALATLLRATLGVGAPGSALSAVEGVDRVLLLARVALLFVAWWPGRRRRFGIASALFVGSLAARALFVPFALVAVHAAWPERRARAGAFAALLACFALGLAASRAKEVPLGANNAAAETLAWVERDNLFRARSSAIRWAQNECGEGDGHLMLATLDWELGHAVEARALAADVAANGNDEGVRQRASDRLRAWGP